MTTSHADVRRAACLVAALSAGDQTGIETVIDEAKRDGALVGLVLAVAVQHVQVCAEYYDTDCQQILDRLAMEAMNMGTSE